MHMLKANMKKVNVNFIFLETSFSYEDKRLKIAPIMKSERKIAITGSKIKILKIP
ncbi:unnamed protein product [marine sediment metagenome]|uniref:Uncharacterized protein n=1 Tax=marine sediment metagenome TaxID=412755 RepID=X0Z703_9ZZZZ